MSAPSNQEEQDVKSTTTLDYRNGAAEVSEQDSSPIYENTRDLQEETADCLLHSEQTNVADGGHQQLPLATPKERSRLVCIGCCCARLFGCFGCCCARLFSWCSGGTSMHEDLEDESRNVANENPMPIDEANRNLNENESHYEEPIRKTNMINHA